MNGWKVDLSGEGYHCTQRIHFAADPLNYYVRSPQRAAKPLVPLMFLLESVVTQ